MTSEMEVLMSNIRRRTYSNSGVYFDPSYLVVIDYSGPEITMGKNNERITFIDIRTCMAVGSVKNAIDARVYYSNSYQARIDIGNPNQVILSGRTIDINCIPKNALVEGIGTNVSNITFNKESINGKYYKVVNTDLDEFRSCIVQVVNLSDMSTYGTYGVIHDGYGGMYMLTYDYEKLVRLDENFNVVSFTTISEEVKTALNGRYGSYYTFYGKGVILVSAKVDYKTYKMTTDRYLVDLDNMKAQLLYANADEYTYSGLVEPTLVI